jgi:hypothetical protein
VRRSLKIDLNWFSACLFVDKDSNGRVGIKELPPVRFPQLEEVEPD